MSIRVGLYDFFAYTLPGIFYLALLVFWLNTFGLLAVDISIPNGFSLVVLFVIVAAGYITGLLVDPFAYRWMRLFHIRNRDAAKAAFDEFTQQYSWVDLKYAAKDWGILLRAVKSESLEAAADVEQHNVAFIMLRNVSFVFILSMISSVIYYFAVSSNLWALILGPVFLVLAFVAMRRSRMRRHWFYMAVYEAFTAHFLLAAWAGQSKVGRKKLPRKRHQEK